MRLVALALIVACSGKHAAAIDAAVATSDIALPLAWLSSTVTTQTASIIIETVSYLSSDGTLVLNGQVCYPADGAPHPVFVFAHGGFSGLTTELQPGSLCAAIAGQGFAVLEPSYRDEDGSQGAVEVCLGEVDDLLRMVQIGLAQPFADPTRVGIEGGSHGGCITLRALERGVPVVVASDQFGITDMTADYAYWQSQPSDAEAQMLIAQLDQSVGGPPSAFPAAYQARSPIAFVQDLPALPLMIAHGTADLYVDYTQSCTFASAVGGFQAYDLDATGQTVQAEIPAGCDLPGLTWNTQPLPTTWADTNYLLLYNDVGHDVTSPGGMAMSLNVVEFVLTKI